MASLAEMMQYANFTSQNSPMGGVANATQSGIEGYMAGEASARKMRQQQLDNTLKILDIQDKMQKLQVSQREQKFNDNMDKAAGFKPYDEKDVSTAVNEAWNKVGGDARPMVNTAESKIGKMFQGMFGPSGKYETTRGPKGWTIKERSGNYTTARAIGAANETARTKAIHASAENMARAEMAKNVEKDALGKPIEKAKDAPVPADVMVKYLPIATAEYDHDMKTYRKLTEAIQPKKDDPTAGLLAKIADQAKQIETAKNAPSMLERLFKIGRASTPDKPGQTGSDANMDRRKKFDRPLPSNPDKTTETDIWGNLKDEKETDTETDDPDL